jgi:hypothetical protein
MNRRFALLVVIVLVAVPMFANHGWSTYHWSKPGSSVAPPVVMNIGAPWTDYASRVMADWNSSAVIDSPWSFGSITTRRKCSSTTGKIEVCNERYGQNGWLGIAGISITSPDHITKGYTKLNDTYFNMAQYNTPAYRQFVVCQEVGHDFGLGHVNETFTDPNTGSCMDYTNDPDGGAGGGSSNDPNNMHPNAHDYAQLESIYSHLDSTTTVGMIIDLQTEALSRPLSDIEILHADENDFGFAVGFDGNGKPNVFVKIVPNQEGEEGGNELTHVLWAPEDPFDGGDRGPDHGDRSK